MLEAAGVDPTVLEPEIGGDEFVPLMVEWSVTPSVSWRAIWPDGTLCTEIWIDSVSRRVSEVTILNAPAPAGLRPESTAAVEPGGPVFSLALFDPTPDLDPRTEFVDAVCSPSARLVGDWLEISFGDDVPTTWISSETFGFGVDDQRLLIAIRVQISSVPSSSALLTQQ